MSRDRDVKSELHKRNPHRDGYDFVRLVEAYPALKPFVAPNRFGTLSINFFDAAAVRALNAALLFCHYGIEWWELPPEALIPPIPGRADYIHYLADIVGHSLNDKIRCLDVGVGASCIYPIIGRAAYGWRFVGCDVERSSLENSQRIVEANELLRGNVELRHQGNAASLFEGVIQPGERFDITICNPPFHASAADAARSSRRKVRALTSGKKGGKSGNDKVSTSALNFAGRSNELWCEGGERGFLERMILESRSFARQCGWFTSLVSNEDNLPALRATLRGVGVREVREVEMFQGNKRSRILAWRYGL